MFDHQTNSYTHVVQSRSPFNDFNEIHPKQTPFQLPHKSKINLVSLRLNSKNFTPKSNAHTTIQHNHPLRRRILHIPDARVYGKWINKSTEQPKKKKHHNFQMCCRYGKVGKVRKFTLSKCIRIIFPEAPKKEN